MRVPDLSHLPPLPGHWQAHRLKYLASVISSNVDKKTVEGEEAVRLCNYVDVYYNNCITPDLDFMVASASRSEIRKFRLRKDDVVVTKDSESPDDIAVPAYVAQDFEDVLCGYHLAIVRPGKDTIDGRYLFYCFAAHEINYQFRISASGITRFGLALGALRGATFPLPPLAEQRAIADLLDEKTAAIDALIAKKERLIGLLEERRWAVTREVIHRGLRDGLPLVKDSGVPWIGPIPKHWTLIPLKHLCCCLDGKRVPLNATERGTMQGDIPYWGANGVVDHVNEWLFDEPLVLLGEDGAPFFDRCKPVAFFVNEKVWVNNHIHVLRTSHRIDPRFLVHVLNCTEYAHFVDGTTRDKLTQAKMKEIPVALPPHEEQGEIVEFVERISRQTDAVQDRLRRQIDKLREYRQTLISAAVTGQIDVRREVEVPA